MKLAEIAAQLGCAVRGGAADVEIERVRGLDDAGPGDLTFLANPKYASKLATTRASAVIVGPDVDTDRLVLVAPNPYVAFARALGLVHPQPRLAPGVHPSAQVDPTAEIGEGVAIGPLCVVGAGVRLGTRTQLHSHVVLYEGVVIGSDCVLHAGVQVRERCLLGDRVIIQNGVIVGADGFGFAKHDDGSYEKIPQIGIVVVEDDVEIQAGSTVDRAALGETRIGRGTKIDNLVQIAHGVTIGEDSVLCAQVGIAGSTTIGNRVTLTGQVGAVNHITIGDDVIATAQTGIPRSIPAKTIVSGTPAIENRTWLRASAIFGKLPELLGRVRALERRLDQKPD